MGLGMIIRDVSGNFITARSTTVPGVCTVKEAEALGLLGALQWLQSLHFQAVPLKMDAKVVVDSFYATGADMTEYGSIISACKDIFNNNDSFELCFDKRQANQAAHILTTTALINASPSSWFSLHDFFSPVLAIDCNNFG